MALRQEIRRMDGDLRVTQRRVSTAQKRHFQQTKPKSAASASGRRNARGGSGGIMLISLRDYHPRRLGQSGFQRIVQRIVHACGRVALLIRADRPLSPAALISRVSVEAKIFGKPLLGQWGHRSGKYNLHR